MDLCANMEIDKNWNWKGWISVLICKWIVMYGSLCKYGNRLELGCMVLCAKGAHQKKTGFFLPLSEMSDPPNPLLGQPFQKKWFILNFRQ